jgi:formylglycine-generating enzyme required for sulfatase activity
MDKTDIRFLEKILTEAFDDEELIRFCRNHCRDVHDRFATGMTRTQKAHELVAYFERRKEQATLQDLLRQERPKWFTEEVPPITTHGDDGVDEVPTNGLPGQDSSTTTHSNEGEYVILIFAALILASLIISVLEGREPLKDNSNTISNTNPLFPVTVEEWGRELDRRNETFRQCDGYWCYVPGDTYTIGGWQDDGLDNNDEQAEVELQPYWVSKYPITVQQYREFMQAGGYDYEEWWTPHGWVWKETYNDGAGRTQPNYWGDERFRGDNQPVVGVTWYEAAAFAKWLTAQLAEVLPEGHCVRLPTEAEWEAACAYDGEGNRRTYSWGSTPEPGIIRADFGKEWQKDRPAPVGERPAGATACGAQDMVGSVWEWTNSSSGDYLSGSEVLVGGGDFSPGEGDVPLRGGAWGGGKTYIRCGARYWDYPDFWYYGWGFRLFLSPTPDPRPPIPDPTPDPTPGRELFP